MNIPKELAINFVDYIDLHYLSIHPHSGKEEHYANFANDLMANEFSISWSKGGTQASCWDTDGPIEISGDYEPCMIKLDNFLTKYYPNLSKEDFSYIKLFINETETSDSDWYGGCMYTAHKKLSFEKLSTLLMETVYINDYDYIDFQNILDKHAPIIVNMDKDDYYKMNLNNKLQEVLPELKKSSSKHKI